MGQSSHLPLFVFEVNQLVAPYSKACPNALDIPVDVVGCERESVSSVRQTSRDESEAGVLQYQLRFESAQPGEREPCVEIIAPSVSAEYNSSR